MASPPMARADRVNILVVDDRPSKLIAMEALLADLGENVVCVGSGADALRQLLEREFALILLDVNMPDMDGFEAAALIRQRPRLQHIPIIFMTAGSDEHHALQGYSLGAVDYILTPVVPEVLRTKVKVFVDLFKMTEQLKRQAEERVALAEEQARRAAAEAANLSGLSGPWGASFSSTGEETSRWCEEWPAPSTRAGRLWACSRWRWASHASPMTRSGS